MVDESGEKTGGRHQSAPSSDAELLAAVASLREDVARLTDDLARYAESQRVAAQATIAGAVNNARSQLSQAASGVEGFVSDIETDMRTRIRGKPITSVLVAAGVGYALRCARRRR